MSKFAIKDGFARGVSALVGGTLTAQLLLIASSPILTRLYSPEDFGALAVFVGLLAMFIVLASFRYEMAIPLPKDDESAANITVLSLILVIIVSFLVAILFFLYGDTVLNLLDSQTLYPFVWLLPIGIFLGGSYQVLNKWALRKKQFSTIAKTRVLQSLSMLTVQISGFLLGPIALISGQLFGHGAGVGWLARYAQSESVLRHATLQGMFTVLKRYRRFPLYDSWYGVFFTAGQQIPPLLFAALFNPVVAGIYLLAQRVLSLPMTVIGGAIGNVFLPNAAEALHTGTLPDLYKKLVSTLIMLAAPAAIGLIIIGPDLFELVFGSEWRLAGDFARLMAVWLLFQFVTAPFTTLFAVLEKQKHGAAFQAIMFFVRVLAVFTGAHFDSVIVAITFFALGSAFCYLAMNTWFLKALSIEAKCFYIPLLRYLAISILLFIPILLPLSFNWSEFLLYLGYALSLSAVTIYYWREARKIFLLKLRSSGALKK